MFALMLEMFLAYCVVVVWVLRVVLGNVSRKKDGSI